MKNYSKVLLLCVSCCVSQIFGSTKDDLKERWGFFSIKQHFIVGDRANQFVRDDAQHIYEQLTHLQQQSLLRSLREKQDSKGSPVAPGVARLYDQLLEILSPKTATIQQYDSAGTSSSPQRFRSVFEDYADGLGHRRDEVLPMDTPSSSSSTSSIAKRSETLWAYPEIKNTFFDVGDVVKGHQFRLKTVKANAAEIFQSLATMRQHLLLAYLNLKLSGFGKPLEGDMTGLYRTLLDVCSKVMATCTVTIPSEQTLDPKRGGIDYTAKEMGSAAALLQGVTSTREAMITALETVFSKDRAEKIFDDIINGDDNSVPESVQPSTTSHQKSVAQSGILALERNLLQDGSMSFLVFDEKEGKSQAVKIPEIAKDGNKEVAMYARNRISELAGSLIPLSQKVRAFSPHMPLVLPHVSVSSPIIEIFPDTIQTVLALSKKSFNGKIIGVHSFANAKQLGGGALNGRIAQEEAVMYEMPEILASYLCIPGVRGTDVFLNHGDVMVTPGVGNNANIRVLAASMPWLLETKTGGAVTLHEKDKLIYGQETLSREAYRNIITVGIRNLFSAARDAGVNVLLTGAWGSGVYKNDPLLVSEIFAQVLGEDDGTGQAWRHNFERVLFAIPQYERTGAESANFVAYRMFFPVS